MPTRGAPSENLNNAASPPFRFNTSCRKPLMSGNCCASARPVIGLTISTADAAGCGLKLSLISCRQSAAVPLGSLKPLTTMR